jgi:hypothetical protein
LCEEAVDAICVRHAVSLGCTAMLPDEAYRRVHGPALMRALC